MIEIIFKHNGDEQVFTVDRADITPTTDWKRFFELGLACLQEKHDRQKS